MSRWAAGAALVFAAGCSSQRPSGDASASPPASATATTTADIAWSGPVLCSGTVSPPPELPTEAALIGCWQNKDASERWTFRRKPHGGLEVVRELGDEIAKMMPDYARRANEPRDVSFDASAGTFSFHAAGEIHALRFACTKTGEPIECATYSSFAPGEPYHWTGNTIAVERCKTR